MDELNLQSQPQNRDAAGKIGIALFENKRYEESLEVWQEMLALDMADGDVHLWKGDTLFRLQRYEQALEAYRAAAEHNSQEVRQYPARFVERVRLPDSADVPGNESTRQESTSVLVCYTLGRLFPKRPRLVERASVLET